MYTGPFKIGISPYVIGTFSLEDTKKHRKYFPKISNFHYMYFSAFGYELKNGSDGDGIATLGKC